jgi:hypothetical protein
MLETGVAHVQLINSYFYICLFISRRKQIVSQYRTHHTKRVDRQRQLKPKASFSGRTHYWFEFTFKTQDSFCISTCQK